MKALLTTTIATAFAAVAFTTPSMAAASGGVIYIPLGGVGEVVVVDTERDAVAGRIGGLPAVHGLAGTPDGRFLVAGSFEEREQGAEMPDKPAGIGEDEHAAHHGSPPAGAQAADAVVSTVSIVRAADGAVTRRIDVPGAVHHVAVSPDGRLAAVTHPNQGGISVIDLDAFEVVASVATGPLPNYAVFSPDGDRIYVSNAGDDTVSAIDAEGLAVLWNSPVGDSPEHVVLSGDGATLYVNNVEGGAVSVVDVAGRRVVKTIAAGSTLHGIDLSDDGGTLFVAVRGADRLIAVDLATGAERGVRLAPEPYHLAAVRGAGKLYVSSAEQSTVWVVDQKSLAVIGEIPIGGKGHQMVQGPGA